MVHLTVCIEMKGERVAFVLSGPTWTKVEAVADKMKNRIGYCGNKDFTEAVNRVRLMELNLPGGWS
jgi:hypothetical protein